MTNLSTEVLADLIAKRKKCLTQLREVGRKQGELIETGSMADLLRLFPAKQQLIVVLQSLERQLAPFHEQDADSRPWASAEARARCAADAEECRRLIQDVMSMEQAGERKMTVRRDEVASQLQAAATGGRVRDAYLAQRKP